MKGVLYRVGCEQLCLGLGRAPKPRRFEFVPRAGIVVYFGDPLRPGEY